MSKAEKEAAEKAAAEKAAAEKAADKKAPEDQEMLIAMLKDGEKLAVHPSCVAAHERMGWVVS